jgi:pSer/pThr/pTyr-binding forkhead associated (FHA) protein/uncharacterized coiled-coil DUF342 family protein
LVYKDKTGTETEITVSRDFPEVTIGRHTDSSVRTSNASVSRRHALVRLVPQGYELVDQGSSSGTYVNNEKVSRRLLSDGDEIYCGSFNLLFKDDEPAVPDAAQLVYHDDNGVERVISLGASAPRVTVGRNKECDIRTKDTSVSRVHSDFLYSAGRYEVVDLESFNATYVNGRKVSRETLAHNDEIRCGRITIVFYAEAARGPRPEYSSSHIPVVASESGVSPPVQGSDDPLETSGAPVDWYKGEGETLRQLQLECDDLKTKVAGFEADLSATRAHSDQLRKELDDVRRQHAGDSTRVGDLEREVKRKQVSLDAIQEMYGQLKDQSDQQLGQLDQNREELNNRQAQVEHLDYKLQSIQEQHEQGHNQVARYIEENAELKAQVNRLERQTTDSDKNANLFEYELKAAQEQLEELRANISREVSSASLREKDVDELRLVVESKESDLQNRESEIERLRAELSEVLSAAPTAGDPTDIERLRGELDYARSTSESLQNELDALIKAAEPGSDSLLDLKVEIQKLKQKLKEKQGKAAKGQVAPGQINTLKRTNRDQRHRIDALEAELEGLRANGASSQAAAASPTSAGSSADLTAWRADARDVYGALNDSVSQLKNDARLIQDFLTDLRKVYDNYRRVDLSEVATLDRVRIERTLREMDPDTTFEELQHTVDGTVEVTESMKSALRDFRKKTLDD